MVTPQFSKEKIDEYSKRYPMFANEKQIGFLYPLSDFGGAPGQFGMASFADMPEHPHPERQP